MPFPGVATSHNTEDKMKRFTLVFVLLLVLAAACTSAPTPTRLPPTTAPTAILLTATLMPPTATTIPPTATLIPATATAFPPTATPQATKQVKLVYVQGNNPIPGKELWLSYYDENTKTWVTMKATTDKDGAATFSVPEGKSGESFTFIFALSETDVNNRVDLIRSGKGTGLRIPPDPTQTGGTLQTGGSDIKVISGNIQIWVPK